MTEPVAGFTEEDFLLAPMRRRYKASRWIHGRVGRIATRFAPRNYFQGYATTNQDHWLWRLNGWVSRPWIDDYIRRSKDARDRREAKERQMSTGARMIADERQRQLQEEGWSSQRDDSLYPGGSQLAVAGAWYALPPFERSELEERETGFWPWDEDWFKPTTRTRDLVKAGALIAAAIDLRVRQGLD